MGKRRVKTVSRSKADNPSHLLRLSDDLLTRISHMLMCPLMTCVCRRLWRLLRRYHVCSTIFSFTALQKCQSRLRTVVLDCPNQYLDSSRSTHLATTLAQAPFLHYVRLNLRGSGIGGHISSLVPLCAAPSLATLHLDLTDCNLRAQGAIALGELGSAPKLHILHLDLSRNHLGPGGACGLASLLQSHTLQTICLDLRDNGLDHHDALAMASLAQMGSLTNLQLQLSCNPLGPSGCLALSELAVSSTLQCLTLETASCQLGYDGAVPLASLANLPALQRLSLNLRGNGLGPRDAQALSTLAGASQLQALRLDLGRNALASNAPMPKKDSISTLMSSSCCSLDTWQSTKGLSSFNIDASVSGHHHKAFPLGSQRVDQGCHGADPVTGISALAALLHAPQLRSLVLRLDSTRLPVSAVATLASSGIGPSLQCLSLDLGCNGLGLGGGRMVCTLQSVMTSQELHLDLRGNGLSEDDEECLALLGWLPVAHQTILLH